jgi:hypothetical protein
MNLDTQKHMGKIILWGLNGQSKKLIDQDHPIFKIPEIIDYKKIALNKK